jgi:hypothetical protein
MTTQTSNSRKRNGWSRPVALPDVFGRPDDVPEHGVVTLPFKMFFDCHTSDKWATWNGRD